MTQRPKVENAPGIAWRKKGDGWEATWRARADLVKAGFTPKNHPLWSGEAMTDLEAAEISDTCRRLQDEMLLWGRGGAPQVSGFDGALKSLIACYQTDPDSRYHKKRFAVRKNNDIMYRKMVGRHGTEVIADINARLLIVWHKEWSDGGTKLAMGHSFVAQLRTLFAFGATILEDPECERLCAVLNKMRFPSPKVGTEQLTAAQAVLVRQAAHVHFGWGSIALAQAFQFDLMLRQKDVIGEWVPGSEPGISDVTLGTDKWIMGIRWSEIDQNLTLRHTTSKRGKDLEVNLRLAPFVMAELAIYAGVPLEQLTRDNLPASGPLILNDVTGMPWTTAEFRRKWRLVADHAKLPKSVKNMHSRSGAISEATDAGIDLEHIRHAATHSNISMTQRYSRGATDKIAEVMKLREAHRNKKKT